MASAYLTSDQLWKSQYMGCCDQWAYASDGMSLGYEDDQPLIDYYNHAAEPSGKRRHAELRRFGRAWRSRR